MRLPQVGSWRVPVGGDAAGEGARLADRPPLALPTVCALSYATAALPRLLVRLLTLDEIPGAALRSALSNSMRGPSAQAPLDEIPGAASAKAAQLNFAAVGAPSRAAAKYEPGALDTGPAAASPLIASDTTAAAELAAMLASAPHPGAALALLNDAAGAPTEAKKGSREFDKGALLTEKAVPQGELPAVAKRRAYAERERVRSPEARLESARSREARLEAVGNACQTAPVPGE